MVAARRAFLDAGYYQPLATQLATRLEAELDKRSLLVDAGCGEGYYTRQLSSHLSTHHKPPPRLIGFDISKWAVQAAARTQPATWLVASNRQIPLADHSADFVLSIFGFPVYASFRRILKSGGQLLLVEAGQRHLIELREVIYSRIRESRPQGVHEAERAGFVQVRCEELTFTTRTLGRDAIEQVLQMTPHLYRASGDGKERVAQLQHLQLTVDVVIRMFRPQTP